MLGLSLVVIERGDIDHYIDPGYFYTPSFIKPLPGELETHLEDVAFEAEKQPITHKCDFFVPFFVAAARAAGFPTLPELTYSYSHVGVKVLVPGKGWIQAGWPEAGRVSKKPGETKDEFDQALENLSTQLKQKLQEKLPKMPPRRY